MTRVLAGAASRATTSTSDSVPDSGTIPDSAGLITATWCPAAVAATATAAVTIVFPIPVSVPETNHKLIAGLCSLAPRRLQATPTRPTTHRHPSARRAGPRPPRRCARSWRTPRDDVESGLEVGTGNAGVDSDPEPGPTVRSGRWPE